jgi:hypothetical protein
MDEQKFRRHVESLMSMSTDYLMGGLDRGTFVSNLGILAGLMDARTPPRQCTCDLCMGLDMEWDAYGEENEGTTP